MWLRPLFSSVPKPSRSRDRPSLARQPQRRGPSRVRTPTAVAVILACGLLAYANSFTGLFVFDDEPAIAQNTHIRHLWPLTAAMRAPEGTTASGRPLVSLTLALNYALAPASVRDVLAVQSPGAAPVDRDRLLANLWGYHALNLAIHLGTALMLFGVLRLTLSSEPVRGAIGAAAPGLALATTLLWAVHPLQTGAVTYVIQRAESLMGLFLVTTLYCAIRAWNGSRVWIALAGAACALGMASKETMVVAPLIVLLWDWTFGPRPLPVRARLPLYAALAASWLVLAVLVAGGHRASAVGFGFAAWPWWRYLITQAGVIAHYLRLSLVPFPLVLDYGWPPARLGEVWPQVILIAALVAVTLWGIARRSPLAFAGGAFFLILAPTSSVLPIVTEVAAEHRMYLPLASVLAVLVIGVHRALRLWLPSASGRVAIGLTLAAVVAGTALTHARNGDYQDYERIWLDTIEKRPDNARARNNYATALVAQGRYREAEAHVRVAVQVDPASVEAQQTLGVALCAQSRCDEGIPHLEAAGALAPSSPDVQRNLAEAYASRGAMAAAVEHYERALAMRPDDVLLLNRAGWILATDAGAVRNGPRAVALAERAVRITGRQDVESLDTLAAAYAEIGRLDEAVTVASAALALAPAREPAIVPELTQRLALYRAGRPFRQGVVR
jgi:protein O-mannosyl-transferase